MTSPKPPCIDTDDQHCRCWVAGLACCDCGDTLDGDGRCDAAEGRLRGQQ